MAGMLAGRLALVTGATQGIGAATARRLAREGALVAVNGRERSARMESVVAEVDGIAAPADLAEPEQVRALVDRLVDDHGGIDVLVANHAYMTMAPLVEHPVEDWWRVVDTNLGGTFTAAQAVLAGMRARGGGRIVVITSEWGVIGWPGATAYSASKAGLIALVKTLGRELASDGVLVNAVAPGVIDTPQLEVDARDAGVGLAEMHERYARDIPMGRIGRDEEVAAVVAHLCDPAVGAFTGQVLAVNGGSTRGRA
ncbi:SDR family NAD(P)-dependent oxidoreductase [Pseudonocardia nigra]|uniref:SDR family NAD(P)-dependent oxidoreductase n=1 Tax=Pseudonocardia nigra TaxID=1921578 RepID=UPI001C5D54B3|nr:SDR family oxidoreductase [Pseudonocardia nigra]